MNCPATVLPGRLAGGQMGGLGGSSGSIGLEGNLEIGPWTALVSNTSAQEYPGRRLEVRRHRAGDPERNQCPTAWPSSGDSRQREWSGTAIAGQPLILTWALVVIRDMSKALRAFHSECKLGEQRRISGAGHGTACRPGMTARRLGTNRAYVQ